MSKRNNKAKVTAIIATTEEPVVANEAVVVAEPVVTGNEAEAAVAAMEQQAEASVPQPIIPVATRTYKADGPFATIWAYLEDPANAGKDSATMRKELLAMGINRSTVNCQLTRYKAGNGNRVVAGWHGRSKQYAAAKLAALPLATPEG